MAALEIDLILSGKIDPIVIDDDEDGSVDDGFDDGPISYSPKQVLQRRQRHVEKIKSSLDDLIAYIGITADSDQSGDYSDMGLREKRTCGFY